MENKARRVAARRGYRLVKSRRRDPEAIDFGGYMLVQNDGNFVVLGGTPFEYSASIDDVVAYLKI